MFCAVEKPYFVANLQGNKRRKRNATILPSIFRVHASL